MKSVYLTYFCSACGERERDILVNAEAEKRLADEDPLCPMCNGPMTVDDEVLLNIAV